ncbi:MAG: GNAT family N-acetyltransferase [Gammaproteobacteria bacterium]|nr:GNAT family N-acetyltransferase [Gammaproteobacteria bacterium]MBJ54183.1 GNAT family N-acetyltransferase [Gammaproteobacteria bacterium]HBN15828.1 GNAT family N-acetyltransferase [Pseudohongiella sp.]
MLGLQGESICGVKGDMGRFEIKELTVSDWESYKKVRLASLKDSPDSFSSTYEREQAFSEADWKARLRPQPGVNISFPLVAESHGNIVGLASGVIWEEDSTVAHVYQMWVLPESRGKGIATALLKSITAWAEVSGCESMKLVVTATNEPAASLYRSFGFNPSGRLEPLREGSVLETQPMVKKLGNFDFGHNSIELEQ